MIGGAAVDDRRLAVYQALKTAFRKQALSVIPNSLYTPQRHPPPSLLSARFRRSAPIHLPSIPPGFGTGHSLFGPAIVSSSSPAGVLPPAVSPAVSSPLSPSFRRLRRRPSAVCSLSANVRRGAGHGSRCGVLTTRKEMASVVPKSEVVKPERGCRRGGIVGGARRRAVGRERRRRGGVGKEGRSRNGLCWCEG